MTQPTFSLIELQNRADPLLLPWLDLYETAFPPVERIPVSRFLGMLQAQEQGCGGEKHLLAALNEQGEFAGMAALYEPRDWPVAHLWYFATQPQIRSQGLGSWIYAQILARQVREQRTLIYDVEDPREMTTPEARELATRRARFYQRKGARMLSGARVLFAPAPEQVIYLRLMAQGPAATSISGNDSSRGPAGLEAAQAFDLACWLYGDTLLRTGELSWETI